jgi:MFS family permease
MLIFYRNNANSSKNFQFNNDSYSPIIIDKFDADINFVLNVKVFKDLITVFSSILLSAIAYGIMTVLISVRLENYVKNEFLISISTIAQVGSGAIFSKFLPPIAHKIGLTKSIFYSTIICAICCLLMYKFINFPVWLLIIYLYGTSIFACSISRGTIMIDLTPPKLRSIVISIGLTLIPLGSGLSPLILNLVNTNDSILSFVLASAFFLLSYLPIRYLKKVDSIIRENKNFAIWKYIKNSPKIFASCFTASFIMSSIGAFSIIYGLKLGMSQNNASILLTSLLFGTIFNIPIGILCNYINKRFIILFCAICALIIVLILYKFNSNQNIYFLFFLLYGFMSGIKLPANVLINEKYQSNERLIVLNAFARISIIGTIFGILNTGISMKYLGSQGIWITYLIVLIIFLIFWTINYILKFINHSITLKDLTFFIKTTYETTKS